MVDRILKSVAVELPVRIEHLKAWVQMVSVRKVLDPGLGLGKLERRALLS